MTRQLVTDTALTWYTHPETKKVSHEAVVSGVKEEKTKSSERKTAGSKQPSASSEQMQEQMQTVSGTVELQADGSGGTEDSGDVRYLRRISRDSRADRGREGQRVEGRRQQEAARGQQRTVSRNWSSCGKPCPTNVEHNGDLVVREAPDGCGRTEDDGGLQGCRGARRGGVCGERDPQS